MGHLSPPNSIRLGITLPWYHRHFRVSFNYFSRLSNTNSIERVLKFLFEQNVYWAAIGLLIDRYTIFYVATGKVLVKVSLYYGSFEDEFRVFCKSLGARKLKLHLTKLHMIRKSFGAKPRLVKSIGNIGKNFRYFHNEKGKSFTNFALKKLLYKSIWFLLEKWLHLVEFDFERLSGLNCRFLFSFLSGKLITASVVRRYMRIRFIEFNKFNEIVFPMVQHLTRISYFTGLKFRCGGRFSRQQRASLNVFQAGHIRSNTYSYHIDFRVTFAILRFGIGSMRIWLSRGFQIPFKKTLRFVTFSEF